MASQDFPDFDYIPAQKIDHLKQFLDHISQETNKWLSLRAGSRKADYVDRVVTSFKDIRRRNDAVTYKRLKEACEAIGKKPYGYSHIPAPTFNGAGPSRWANGTTAVALPQRGAFLEDWKPSPMWKPLRALTAMTMLPDINANELQARKERKVHFQLSQDVIDMLKTGNRHSVRLFCTSNEHYRQPGAYTSSTAHLTNKKLPIEYPTAPDFVVDDYHLRYTERGLRGKPGSAPPVDLHRTSKGLSLVPGTLRSVVFGHTGPTTGKKKDVAKRFFFQVVFCEWTPKEELLSRLERLTPTEQGFSQNDDDDIVFGVSKMTLKDKLSYMRIKTPLRSKQCAHLQCFEAKWWIEANSVHPQWLCPLCDKELAFEDIFVDGFFLRILNAVPEDVEEVVMEGDGEWHTEDSMYGSVKWMAENGKPVKREPTPKPPSGGKRKAIEVLSSDDEDEPLSRSSLSIPYNRPGSTSSNPLGSSARPSSTRSNDVIDLTLDSDEETTPAPDFQIPSTGYTNRSAPLAGAGGLYPPPPLRSLPSETGQMESVARNGATPGATTLNTGVTTDLYLKNPRPLADRIDGDRYKRPRVDEDLVDADWSDWFEKTRGEEDRGWRSSYRA